MDRFKVEVITKTPNPQQVIYAAMHQDYCEDFVFEQIGKIPPENECGDIVVKRLLLGDRGHWGPCEHPQITFNCGYFPHSVMQQARTHRVGVTLDCQSMRYTGKRISVMVQSLINKKLSEEIVRGQIENVFYLRPVGDYRDRQGKKYHYSAEKRYKDLCWCYDAAVQYAQDLEDGLSEEHARGKLPFDYRQHFVVSFNLRSFLHFLDLRCKKDAQIEIQQLCELMLPHLKDWVPEIAEWYIKNRLGKARLAP